MKLTLPAYAMGIVAALLFAAGMFLGWAIWYNPPKPAVRDAYDLAREARYDAQDRTITALNDSIAALQTKIDQPIPERVNETLKRIHSADVDALQRSLGADPQ